MSRPPAEARFPHVAASAPHYESYFLKGVHPSQARAFWLRHTVHQRPGRPRTASLWLTLFDAGAADHVRAGKQTVGPDGLKVPAGGGGIAVDGATFTGTRAAGALRSPTLEAEWDLTLADTGAPAGLPAAWMYDARVPRTKTATPWPGARLAGTMAGWDLDGWTGLASHNWGAEHASRWIWTHCGRFADRGNDTWLELALVRVGLGRFTLPWLANGALELDGVRHRLGGPRRARATKVAEDATGARFLVAGGGIRVEGEVRAAREHLVAWRYSDPDGPEHHTAHSSIADMRVEVRLAGHPPQRLEGRRAATYELGMHETDHGLALQPYADGEL